LPKSFYEVLGVPEEADPAEIKRAYRRLARKLHPDVNPGKKAVVEMSDVNEAYRVLGDAGRRASYDAQRNRRISGAPTVERHWSGGIYVRHHLSIVDLPSPVEAIEFVGARPEIAIAGFDNTLRFCSSATGATLGEVRLEGSAASYLQWCGKLGLFAGGSSEKSASIWQIKSRQVASSARKKVDWISRVAISPTGNVAVLVSAHKTALVMDAQTGETLYVRRKHEDAVTAVAIAPDGKHFATGGNDQKVILWDVATGMERAVLEQRAAVTNLKFSKDGSMLAVVLVDHGTRVFELATGNLRTTLWGHEKPIEDVDFHPDGNYLATASRDSTVGLWSLSDGSLKHRLAVHTAAARCVRFSADGRTLASGGLDRRVGIHRVITG
jgi:WD40 repeat protein